LGYQPFVAARLEGSVAISGPNDNCRDSANVHRRIGNWVRPNTVLLVFNAGLHDVIRSQTTGRRRVEIERYETNLADIVRDLDGWGIRTAFATTTPVDDERCADSGKPQRLDADVRRYNETARRLMAERKVPVVDLYPLIDPTLLAADGVHLTVVGCAIAAEEVATGIAALL